MTTLTPTMPNGTTTATAGTIESDRAFATLRGEVEARVTEAYANRPQVVATPEIAELQGWWDIAAFGPFQILNTTFPGPAAPHAVIKAGEIAWVATLILLNPDPYLPPAPGVSPYAVISGLAPDCEVRYQTGNLTTWTLGSPNMQALHTLTLAPPPGGPFYVDWLGFVADEPGLYEMNISARILGDPPFANASRFGAWATTVVSPDAPGLFGPRPPAPMRFLVYP